MATGWPTGSGAGGSTGGTVSSWAGAAGGLGSVRAITWGSAGGRGRAADITATLLSAWAWQGSGRVNDAVATVERLGGEPSYNLFRDYNAGLILDASGRPYKVVKFATDVSAQKLANANFAGQIEAIGKSQAVIEFDLDGTITDSFSGIVNSFRYALAEVGAPEPPDDVVAGVAGPPMIDTLTGLGVEAVLAPK